MRYQVVEGMPEPELIQLIEELGRQVGLDVSLAARFEHFPGARSDLAFEGSTLVGFKCGYADRPDRFYSWVGGVHPSFRRRGIGEELMRRQHEGCRDWGYQAVRTMTTNEHRPMLLLNIRSGFDVIGTTTGRRGFRIVLEKAL